ncbi:TIM barrel protein, partial [Acidobacteria bacterium AH-259-L09]|nr:TIM barrel protein [Acidobacteria bacterium AH-259-L09]
NFLKISALGGLLGSAFGNLSLSAQPEAQQAKKRKYHLRYAPRLDFLRRELSIPERLELFAEHGFDATEYNGLMRHALNEVEEIRKKLDSLGMQMGIFVANPGGWSKSGLSHPAERDEFLVELKRAIEYHRVIGNNFCTVITGPERMHISRLRQQENVIEGLKRAAEILEKTELTIVIEPLNVLVNHPGYFLVHSEEAAEIMSAVGSPQVRILFDIYHQQISEGNLINNIREYRPYIGYFQVGDVPGRKEPGTGEVNWKNVFKAIYQTGYRGFVGMEHGLSQPGRAGLLKCFEEYHKADSW